MGNVFQNMPLHLGGEKLLIVDVQTCEKFAIHQGKKIKKEISKYQKRLGGGSLT